MEKLQFSGDHIPETIQYVTVKEEKTCLLGQAFSCAVKGVLDCKKEKKKKWELEEK